MYKLIIPMIVFIVVTGLVLDFLSDYKLLGFVVAIFIGAGASVLTMSALKTKV